MANNDRLAKGGEGLSTPGWKGDENVVSTTPLVTKNLQGEVAWSQTGVSEQIISKLVVTKNAYGTPGWRNRVVVPEGLYQISYKI